MAAPNSLPALLESLTQSLSSALEAAPKVDPIEPPANGISLLDVKNELLLSYLQNLVFLILLKLRNARASANTEGSGDKSLTDTVVKKLVELRLYLEKGVRPLEDKLRYQIEKALRAADDAERNARARELADSKKAAKKAQKEGGSGSESGSGSGSEEDEEDGRDESASGEDEDADEIEDLHLYKFQARPDAFVRPASATAATKSTDKNGVYRPPRIAPTTMPAERKEKKERRPHKSATMDEFIESELSTAPIAEPSIGTTIVGGGRGMKTAKERREEAERIAYEETNFTRLAGPSKKEKAKQAGRSGRMQFGGEEWRDLGEGVDRINRLTTRKESGKGTRALLEKSRKRGRETTDGPKRDGTAMGERYQKRLKVLEGGRRDRGKGR
jgi:U3 small nucleolar ribonucleoprotein protein LCP5